MSLVRDRSYIYSFGTATNPLNPPNLAKTHADATSIKLSGADIKGPEPRSYTGETNLLDREMVPRPDDDVTIPKAFTVPIGRYRVPETMWVVPSEPSQRIAVSRRALWRMPFCCVRQTFNDWP